MSLTRVQRAETAIDDLLHMAASYDAAAQRARSEHEAYEAEEAADVCALLEVYEAHTASRSRTPAGTGGHTMTINERILNAQRDVDSNNETGEMVNLVKQRYNCYEANIDSDGGIWISDPMTGHWLSDSDKADLLDWIAKQ